MDPPRAVADSRPPRGGVRAWKSIAAPGRGGEVHLPLPPPPRGGNVVRGTRRGCEVGHGLSPGYDIGNDPSAGSPTETLLRLLLPLNDQV